MAFQARGGDSRRHRGYRPVPRVGSSHPRVIPGERVCCLRHPQAPPLLPSQGYLQHLQPPQGPEGPFLNTADVVLVQLSVEQRRVVGGARCLEQGALNVLT